MRPHACSSQTLSLPADVTSPRPPSSHNMTSPVQTEPMPSSISQKLAHAPPCELFPPSSHYRNLQRWPKLFLGFDKSCSVYYDTWYRGEKPKSPLPQKIAEYDPSCIIHHRSWGPPGWRCLAGELLWALWAQACSLDWGAGSIIL